MAVGVMALVLKSQERLGASYLNPGRWFTIQSGQSDLASEKNLRLPLVGRMQSKGRPTPIVVPPPVVPETLSPDESRANLQGTAKPISPLADLPASHWAFPVVTELLTRGLVTGFPDGSFRPDQPMTRAEFASQLARTFQLSFKKETQAFADVTAMNWAHQDIQKSVRMGFLTGYPEGKFFPNETIDRIQVITALTQGLNLKSSSGSLSVLRYYRDYDQVPDWATKSLVAATEAGLIVNHPDVTLLTPNRPASRAEVTAMLYRSLVYVGHLEDINSPHWVQPEPLAY